MHQSEYLDFFNLRINKVTYSILLKLIESSLVDNNSACITYVNANTLNIIYKNKKLRELYSKFDIIHPDGIGVFLASKFLYGERCFTSRINGSDLYLGLIDLAILNDWSFFFLGDIDENLKKIGPNHPELNVVGYFNGYTYNEHIIEKINSVHPDILIVGLGSPKQEIWIQENKCRLNAKIILAVGDGIKIFAGVKKRGFPVLRKLGLEWLVRLIGEPKRLWGRYLLGIPLFLFRITKVKILS
jgi:N-acetylglucosaminyldiphosphoundecaprenol N-acetyl-beta-D-mannosaminyltransferase